MQKSSPASLQLVNIAFNTYTFIEADPTAPGRGGRDVLLTFSNFLDSSKTGDLDPASFQLHLTATDTNKENGAIYRPDAVRVLRKSAHGKAVQTSQVLLSFNEDSAFTTALKEDFWNGANKSGISQNLAVTISPHILVDVKGRKNPAINSYTGQGVSGKTSEDVEAQNPASLPVAVVFDLSEDLKDYLKKTHGSGEPDYDPNDDVYISFSGGDGVTLWGQLPTVPGQPLGQTGAKGSVDLDFATNYRLSDLQSLVPEGGQYKHPLSGQEFFWGPTRAAVDRLGKDTPNILLNAFTGGRVYVSIGKPIDYTNNGENGFNPITYAPSASNPADANKNVLWQELIEPFIGLQPGFNAKLSSIDGDLTYIDFFLSPINLDTLNIAGAEPVLGLDGHAESVNGGVNTAGKPDKTAAIAKALSEAGLQKNNSFKNNRYLSPGQAPAGTYHDWSTYLKTLSQTNPTTSIKGFASGNYDLNAFFLDFHDGNTFNDSGFIVLQGAIQGTKGSLYLPHQRGRSPAFYNEKNYSGFTYLESPAGIYGGNAGWVWYEGIDLKTEHDKDPAKFASYLARQKWQQISTGGGGGVNPTIAFAVGDVLSGLNFGLIGSTVKFEGKAIGSLPSNGSTFQNNGKQAGGLDWWGNGPTVPGTIRSQGAARDGYWGKWAQPEQAKRNLFWNTWAYALNGSPYVGTPGAKPDLSQALVPDVYGYAYSDRFLNNLIYYNPLGNNPGSSGNPPFGVGAGNQDSAGFLKISIGAPVGATAVPPTNVDAAPPIPAETGSAKDTAFEPPFAPPSNTSTSQLPAWSPVGIRFDPAKIGLLLPSRSIGPSTANSVTIYNYTSLPDTSASFSTLGGFAPLTNEAAPAGLATGAVQSLSQPAAPPPLTPWIVNPAAADPSSLTPTLGIQLAETTSLAAFHRLLQPTETASIGAGNAALVPMAASSFGIYGQGREDPAAIALSTGPEIRLRDGGGAIHADYGHASELSLSTGVFRLRDSGPAGASLSVWSASVAANANTLLVYGVDSITGALFTETGWISPGDGGYAAASLDRAITISALEPSSAQHADLTLANGFYAFALVSGGSVEAFLAAQATTTAAPLPAGPSPLAAWFSVGAANPDGIVHMLPLAPGIYGFEDQWGGGDLDYNDVVMSIRGLAG
ncbi:hypothetical protein KBY97_06885 [Synechococcus sp. ATX 2A4]|uniref:beta-1,3-glucanase family protein n=1 Tax=Synechococcus sp. ATX 2A4 TaxID=2823727 RepID=UPI0020CBFD66|nr:beta-1,3-glucanase family protein [Synechococcus sp. ATX 2A4]MCP9884852.1 hypothetical protein [Synechococcus sp. ATX 2A4]